MRQLPPGLGAPSNHSVWSSASRFRRSGAGQHGRPPLPADNRLGTVSDNDVARQPKFAHARPDAVSERRVVIARQEYPLARERRQGIDRPHDRPVGDVVAVEGVACHQHRVHVPSRATPRARGRTVLICGRSSAPELPGMCANGLPSCQSAVWRKRKLNERPRMRTSNYGAGGSRPPKASLPHSADPQLLSGDVTNIGLGRTPQKHWSLHCGGIRDREVSRGGLPFQGGPDSASGASHPRALRHLQQPPAADALDELLAAGLRILRLIHTLLVRQSALTTAYPW